MLTRKFGKSAKAGVTSMLKTYLDANVTIYYVQQVVTYFDSIRKRMVDANGAPLVTCTINELLLMEVRVKPLREKDSGLLARFDFYFETFASHAIVMDKAVFELATELRVRHRVKTPDALHLAAAIHAGCDQFWTNDDRLAKAAAGHIDVINIGEPHGTNT